MLQAYELKLSLFPVVIIIGILLLSFTNWLLESMKWKYVMNTATSISWFKAYIHILRGISMGIITPASIGEYYGRTLNLDTTTLKLQSVSATFYSSVAQNAVNIVFGIIAMLVLISKDMVFNKLIDVNGIYLSLSIVFLIFVVYFKLESLVGWFSNYFKIRLPSFYKRLKPIRTNQKFIILGISILRYFTYWVQYLCFLHLFNIPLGIIEGGIGVSIIYLIQTGIPLPGGLSILARSSIAIAVFSLFEVNEISILLASWSLWAINLMIPALLGVTLLFKVNKFA